jgi:two-component system cell cycle sensor histidine kinase/response regulator CckA
MTDETKVLMLEDLVADSMLLERELRQASIKFVSKRVETKEAFLEALVTFQPDIILSDYSLPQFSGLDALRLLKETRPDLPFILITGSLTEEVAVECMKEGAHDYILKTSLKRLPSAVLNALAKRRKEQDKEKAEELYRLIAENTTDLICLLDTRGMYAYVSPSHKDLLGYSPEDLIGRSAFSIIHPDDQEEAHKCFTVSLERNKGGTLECRLQHVDGSWRAFDVVGNWIFDGHDTPQRAILVSRDLSERKLAEKALRESEEQLRQAQKLEAIGQLAGGVAHDFNNLLTVITGYSDLLLNRIAEGDSNHSRVEEIKRAAERASSLTRQLLAFSRKQVLQPKLFDLNTLVADLGKMLQRLIGEDIDLTMVLTKDVAEINADPGQIEQVLMNLVVNARDAMPDGGKITIETAHVQVDQAYAESHLAVQPGPYVMLAVTDTGSGMDQETQKHIFEPFFTTKEQGKGTGLGLSTVYGIVKQSGGNIWIYSELGQGTTFKVYLPQARDSASLKRAQMEPAIMMKGTETILLVEDEPQIRALAYEFLSDKGYKVLPSSNGNEALDILEEHLPGVHLIVTDVVMPQMSGRELADRAIAISPGTKVLFMSGYTNDAIVRHGVLNPDTWFIQKPFGPDALARKVREVLDASPAANILVPDSGAQEQPAETKGI